MRLEPFAVPVKLWAFCCVLTAVLLTRNGILTWTLTLFALAYAALQRRWRIVLSYGSFYALLGCLLYAIRFHQPKMVFFSEFHLILFWSLSPIAVVSWDLIKTPPGELSAFLSRMKTPTPVILGLLVVFRFFPTMKTEVAAVIQSMRNRGLTAPAFLLRRPLESLEFILVPLLLRCLQIADQLSVSAVARGAERPGIRGSYFGNTRLNGRDWAMISLWSAVTAIFLIVGDVRSWSN